MQRRGAARLARLTLAATLLTACAAPEEAPEQTPPGPDDEVAGDQPSPPPSPESDTDEHRGDDVRDPGPEGGIRPYRELPDDIAMTRELVAEAPDQVTDMAVRPGDERLFLADKQGRVWVVDGGFLAAEPFLDLEDQVLGSDQLGEQGLLSVAFHPTDAHRLFVYYVTAGDDDTRLSEFRVDPSGDRADADSERAILDVEQPFRWHNGGHVVFAPDGMLWLSLGDGGLRGDPHLVAQDPTNLLGTILRLDVDGDEPYAVPADNPFADGEGGAPEVWAYGLRNPWRMAIDPVDWRVYVTDVGQYVFEWVNVVGHDEGGANFGWPIVEGSTCFAERTDRCPGEGLTDPVLEYTRVEGECAIIGAHVYDGPAFPELAGHFFYADLCAGWLRSFRYHDGQIVDERDWTDQLDPFDMPVAVGAGPDGELLVSDDLGSVWRIVPAGEA